MLQNMDWPISNSRWMSLFPSSHKYEISGQIAVLYFNMGQYLAEVQ